MHASLIASGIVALVIGCLTLLRPSIARGLLGIAEGERATYALRMAGSMIGAFGLVLVGFAIALGQI